MPNEDIASDTNVVTILPLIIETVMSDIYIALIIFFFFFLLRKASHCRSYNLLSFSLFSIYLNLIYYL